MINVLVVDDQRTARQVLESAVFRGEQYRLVNSIGNAAMAEMYCMNGEVDLILMDVYTDHRESGLAAAEKIKKLRPGVKIIIVTSMPEESFIRKARAAGCESFWYKDVGDEDLLDVMNRTMAGESVYPDATPVLQIGMASSVEFTERELQVLRGLVAGQLRADICEDLGISERTLKYHIGNLLSKTGYDNTLGLSVDVVDKKLIIPGF